MRRRTALAVLSLLAASTTSVFTGPAAASPRGDQARDEAHQRIVDYWTPERMAEAQPRDVAVLGTRPGNSGASGQDRVLVGTWKESGARVAQTTGKVFFVLGGQGYVCSAAAVDGATDLVLTAGHCVGDVVPTEEHEEPRFEFASLFLFVPSFDGTVPAAETTFDSDDVWTARALYTTAGWQDGEYADDAGVAVVGGKRTFEEAFEKLPPVTAADAPEVDGGAGISAFGYSSGKSWKGRTLGYCQGPLERATFNDGVHALRCQLGGGASGGPWYDDLGGDGAIFSLSSFLRQGDNRVYGPVFDDPEHAMLEAASRATCDADDVPCTVVAPYPPTADGGEKDKDGAATTTP